MIEQEITLLTNGRISFQKCGNGLQFGYSKNRGVYSIKVKTSGEWNGLTIRAFWHIPDIKEPITSLLVDNVIRVPALVTSYKGEGRIVFEGSDGAKTVTSADVRYYVNKNSGTCDGTIPEPGTPAWQELVGTVKKYSDTAVEAKESAKKSADEAKQALEDTKDVKNQAIEEINSSKTAAIEEIENKKNLSIEEINSVKEDAKGELETLCDSTRDFANQAKEAADRAKASEDASKKNADDSAATLQELKDGIASGDFKGDKGDVGPAGADGKDAPQIDDTTVTDSAPWSSKHIVDVLCPPISETGNPVQCYPVSGYPLGCKASWEPVQEGSGTPSSENIRPIKGRNSVTVTRCGENLWSLGNVGFKQYKEISTNYPAGKYVLSYKVETESTDDTVQVGWLVDGKWKYSQEQKNQQIKISIIASVGISGFRFYAGSSPAYRGNATYKNIQLELWNDATTYSPYTGQTTTLTLPETIYGGTVDAVTGEGKETWNEITLINTYSWYASTNQYRTFYCVNIKNITQTVIENSAYAKNWKCTHFKNEAYAYAQSGDMDNTVSFQSDRETLVIVFPGTIDELKSYLAAQHAAGTPVQIAYKLAEPVPFTATDAQPIHALSGTNTVITDVDSVTVTGRADPIKRITDLEDAVASMTTT